MPLTKLVCLDRDGTINYDPGFFGKDDEWIKQLQVYKGVAEGIKRLKAQGVKISVVSNQAGIALGYFDEPRVLAINQEIARRLSLEGAVVDSWHFCPWVSNEYANKKETEDKKPIRIRNWVDDKMSAILRKPATGMIDLSTKALGLVKEKCQVYVFGDKIEDVQTGLNAQGIGILFDNGENKEAVTKTQAMQSQQAYQSRVFISKSLLDTVEIILNYAP